MNEMTAENLRSASGGEGQAHMRYNILTFYLDGFRSMRLGRTLWKIILVKLLVLFAIIKLFFFPDVLKRNYDSDAARAEHVLHRLTQTSAVGDDGK